MQDQEVLTAEEVADLRRLLAIEKIRKVVQLYSHYMDGRDFAAMAQLYTEDAVCEWGPFGTWRGRAQILETLTTGHADRGPYDGFHCTTNLWIELTGPATATSRAYLTDVWPSDKHGPITHAGYPINPVVLYAIYENDYALVDGSWKIARSVIQFMWPERIMSASFPRPMAASDLG